MLHTSPAFSLKAILFCFLSIAFLNLSIAQNTKSKVDTLCREAREVGNFKIALSKADSAYTIAKSINYVKGIQTSNLTKVVIYANFGDTKSCLKKIDEIETGVLESQDADDIAFLKFIKGGLYAQLQLFNEAKNEFNKSLLFAEKITDNDLRHYRKSLVYFAYAAFVDAQNSSHNKHDLMLSFLHKSYNEAVLIKKSQIRNDNLNILFNAFASFYVHTKDFNQAKKYFEKCIEISKKRKNQKTLSFLLLQMGKMYVELKDYDNAILSYNKSIIAAKQIRNDAIIELNYKDLASIYEKLHDKENHSKYLKLRVNLNDSLRAEQNKVIGGVVSDITKEMKSEHNKDSNRFWLYLIIISILLLLLIYLSIRMFKKYNLEKVSKVQLAFLLDEKMILLNSLSSKTETDEEELKNVVRLAITKDASFILKFNELFPNFRTKLLELEPTLRSNDLKFCSYLKLNFDTKEIARYTGDSVRAVESKKYRLRKKFNFSSSEDINIWFSNF